MQKLSIIIPVYNEEKTILEILERVSRASLPHNVSREVIVIDDGSNDGTRKLLSQFGNHYRLVFLKKNKGKGAALKEGFRISTGDYILIQDADLEYNPADYSALVEPVIRGEASVVFGSRALKRKDNIPFSSWYFYGGLFLTKIFNLLFSTSLTDFATCYKLFPARFAKDLLQLPSQDFVYDVVELTHFLTGRSKVIEVPISYHSRLRKEGKKINWRHGIKCLIRMIKLRISVRW